MKIFLGADHGGFELKTEVYEHLIHAGFAVEDCGASTLNPDDDFPQYAFSVATKVLGEPDDEAMGILMCRSGNGMAIAANRVAGIRAALAWDKQSAIESRDDNNANVLCIHGSAVDQDEVIGIIDAWLATPFSGEERYIRRNAQIEELYG